MSEADVPSWASLLDADGYARFRAELVAALRRMGLTVDADHIDCGVLYTQEGGSLGLSNLVRLCHPIDPANWAAAIADHLRRSTAKAVAMAFELAGPRLRVRLVPARHVDAKPDAYVVRELASGLRVALAIDNPEHVVFVSAKDLTAWGQTADALFALAEGNTRDEPELDRQNIELDGGATITALLGGSYFAASHVLFLERYLPACADGHLVAVPDRHACAALPLDGIRAMNGLGPMVRLAYARFHEEPGAITDQLYWRRSPTDFVKIPCGVRDDGGPWVAPPDEFNAFVERLGTRN